MAAIDRKLKACRAALQEAGGGAAAVRAKAKADKAARKAVKVAEQRRAAEAAVGILPGDGGEAQPPAKLARQASE